MKRLMPQQHLRVPQLRTLTAAQPPIPRTDSDLTNWKLHTWRLERLNCIHQLTDE